MVHFPASYVSLPEGTGKGDSPISNIQGKPAGWLFSGPLGLIVKSVTEIWVLEVVATILIMVVAFGMHFSVGYMVLKSTMSCRLYGYTIHGSYGYNIWPASQTLFKKVVVNLLDDDTLPETNITPKNGCLEYDPFLLGRPIFRGDVSFIGCFGNTRLSQHYSTSWWLNQPIWKICSSNWIISPNRG